MSKNYSLISPFLLFTHLSEVDLKLVCSLAYFKFLKLMGKEKGKRKEKISLIMFNLRRREEVVEIYFVSFNENQEGIRIKK